MHRGSKVPASEGAVSDIDSPLTSEAASVATVSVPTAVSEVVILEIFDRNTAASSPQTPHRPCCSPSPTA